MPPPSADGVTTASCARMDSEAVGATCARQGVTAPHARSPLPHHRLQVFHVARELLICVRDAQIRDAKLRDEATRAAKGTCLNIAEGAARVTRADKARAYAIARGEAAEVGAAIEIAVLVGAATADDEAKIVTLASRVVAMLTRLIK